ncbi:hypothetical protein [Rhizobium sp. J15]|uniref:hypothetical protein n=1 Tax=Rhizobium sp. J15 TaxID=2035450 RepID=UPI001AEC9D53|nr:hypothetical protein [Rhizobium sp. J15]
MKQSALDPELLQANLLRNDGAMLRFYLGAEYDNKLPMGNVARSHLNFAIELQLVGFRSESDTIVHRANRWLDNALAHDEKLGANQDLHRTLLHWACAIGTWLENGSNDEGHWNQARVHAESAWRFEARPWPRNEIIKSGLDDYMAFAYRGGAHEAGIDMYEHWIGEKPLSLKKALKPREFGYALCLHRARGRFGEDELFEAGRRMLQANLEQIWLGGG